MPSWQYLEIGKLSRLHLYLDEHMEAKGMSDADMAEALGTNRETVWRWRTGKHKHVYDLAVAASRMK